VRPLPRLHAITDDAVLADADVGIRASAIAAAGPSAALHVRARRSPGAFLARSAERFMSLAAPPQAAVIVNGRPDLALAVGAEGVQLGAGDLLVADARRVLPRGWIGRSVHGIEESRAAADAGADYLLLGSIFATPSHPGAPPLGLATLERVSALGCPVIAIGGITPATAAAVRDAGAWGVAAVRALWGAADPYAAAITLLAPWSDAA
jgi:thiamine-phosphate pyrophosphorylase